MLTKLEPRGLDARRRGRRGLGGGLRICALLVVISGCATSPDISDGKRLIAEGQFEEGLALLEQAANDHPRSAEAYTTYVTRRNALAGAYLRDADALRAVGDYDRAQAQYARVLAIDPQHPLAVSGLDMIDKVRSHYEATQNAEHALQMGDLGLAENLARQVLAEDSSHRAARAIMRVVNEKRSSSDALPPALRAAMGRKISMEMRDAPLSTIFEIISREGSINFILDRDVRSDGRASMYLRDTSLEDIINVLLVTHQLARKVLNDNTVIIYPATQAKHREYQELTVRSFYLSNANAQQTAAMIRALVKSRDLYVDEKLNLLVMRDTPEAIRLAEQLVATQDVGEPEVMLELEVLEVASSLIQELGLRYPDQIRVLGLDSVGGIPDAVNLRSPRARAFVSNPLLELNLREQDGRTSILANPRIRVMNREKAMIHIGERVPVITTTATANVGVSSSVNYLETGLKLDVEPTIHLNDDVSIRVQLEVSNILEQLNISGTVSYRLGTRTTATMLRLRDGETQVLAGLINNEDRTSMAKLPYLADFPVLGRLFRNNDDRASQTEVVLLITPRVVRNLERSVTVPSQFQSGTEALPGAEPLQFSSPGAQMSMVSEQGAALFATTPVSDSAIPIELSVSVPAQVSAGQEFGVSFSLPAGNQEVTASMELRFDPSALEVLGSAGAEAFDGTVSIDVASPGVAGVTPSPVNVRFRALVDSVGSTEIALDLIDSGGVSLVVPPAQVIEIVESQ